MRNATEFYIKTNYLVLKDFFTVHAAFTLRGCIYV